MGFFDFCRVRRCLCCSLRFGCLFFGCANIIIAAVGIIFCSAYLYNLPDGPLSDGYVVIGFLVLFVLILISSFLVLFGVWTDWPDFIHFGAVCLAILMVIDFFWIILYTYEYKKMKYKDYCLVLLVYFIFALGLLFAELIVINSYKHDRRECLEAAHSEYYSDLF